MTTRCKECGKTCRTTVEEEQHTRFTGHSEFEEDEGVNVVRTEEEMEELRGESCDPPPGTDMGKEPDVDAEQVQQLVEMGFSRNKAVRALYFSGGGGVESALEWITTHEEDPQNSDEVLRVEAPKPKLSAEEAKAKAEELVEKAKAKREAEEREMEKIREAERIRSGKEMAAIARKEEEQRLKRMAEERLREKQEEARAREKIKKKLEQDRMERRAALGLPTELTEEEKEEERRRMEEKKSKGLALPVKPIEKINKMRDLMVDLKKKTDDRKTIAFQTLQKIVGNIVAMPDNPKYRGIKLDNPAIQDRIGRFPEALEFLRIAGFVESKDSTSLLTLPPEATCMATLTAAMEILDSALHNEFFGVL